MQNHDRVSALNAVPVKLINSFSPYTWPLDISHPSWHLITAIIFSKERENREVFNAPEKL
jgi:hypothetical protein